MITTRGKVCALGFALILAAGCANNDFFSLSYWQRDSSGQTSGIGFTRTSGGTTVTLAGSPDAVSQQFRNAFARLGVQAQVTTDMEGVHIAATTKTGKHLNIGLKYDGQTGGTQTQVEMQWTDGADKEVESQLMSLVVGAGRR
jgi:hypothetical protein